MTALDTKQAELKLLRDEDDRLVAVTAAVGDPEAFKAELTRYVQQFPDSPRAADFKRSLDRFPLWVAAIKWNELLTALSQIDVTRLDPAAAKKILCRPRK